MTYHALTWTQQDGCLTVEFNRPEALNALTASFRRELLDALSEADQNESIRVVVLRAAGRAFSVGQDLKEMQQYYADHGPALGQLVEDEYIPLVKALRSLSKPTIAVLQGAAVGGGMALALATDFRVITEKAQLVPGFVNVGLAPDTGTTFLLARSIGYARALSLCLLGQPIRAEAMVQYGLAFATHDSTKALDDELNELVTKLSKGPTRAYASIRRLFDVTAHESLTQVLSIERDIQDELAHTGDHLEAVEAFLAKRQPVFHGA